MGKFGFPNTASEDESMDTDEVSEETSDSAAFVASVTSKNGKSLGGGQGVSKKAAKKTEAQRKEAKKLKAKKPKEKKEEEAKAAKGGLPKGGKTGGKGAKGKGKGFQAWSTTSTKAKGKSKGKGERQGSWKRKKLERQRSWRKGVREGRSQVGAEERTMTHFMRMMKGASVADWW